MVHKRCETCRLWNCQCAGSKLDADTTLAVEAAVSAGRKFDGDKLRFDLLPPGPISRVVEVLTFGARKYSADNWKFVDKPKRRYFAAAVRHLFAWAGGEKLDPESGKHHLAHAACCILFLLHFEEEQPGPIEGPFEKE